MYPDSMFNFAAASEELGLSIDEILEVLDLTPESAERENLTVSDIIEAVEDSGYFGDDDWAPGCDSVSNFIDA